MVPSLRNRQKKNEEAVESASHTENSIVKSKRAPVSKEPKSRKKVKKEESKDNTEKNEEEVENETESEKKTKTKTSIKHEASADGPVKKIDKEYQHWLMKAEPDSRVVKDKDVKFSTSQWDGVRNFEARNMMRDRMKVGHKPGVAGIAEIVKEGYVDYTAFDPKHPYFDPKSEESNPKWYMVDVKFVRKLNRLIPLKELQSYKELSDMVLIRRGRLSVQPVSKEEYDFILSVENKDDD
ncbi:hypothetical protein K450DRAFT_196314 [Umbelopsis ramanniana AG]|uniref:EVE domain-containing protein n=1 Tax=Umbelopsis ramanniana AG TaxID=1314678 RepID=A0AAD5EFX4_UMBRA|nr:uncharacterized protein K450DRAFT_196314 [Umbelopsis ramanniana AG]KAI8583116.1 hypothetical protein K450DRAFT_196314 [Umbelopsis ramanniana AG]